MAPWLYALAAAVVVYLCVVSFISEDDPKYSRIKSTSSKITLLFFLLIIFMTLAYWFNIGGDGDSGLLSGGVAGGGANVMTAITDKLALEKEMIRNINLDMAVGLPPF